MPDVPVYVHKIKDALDVLGAMSEDIIDRRTLQEILGVSKWTAWRVLKRCGAREGPGRSLVCRREELMARLQALQEDSRFSAEIGRHQRVEDCLDRMVQFASRKHRKIVRNDAAIELVSSRFSRLPPGVELQPGRLQIDFFGTEDFLQKFGAVVYALQNDYEQISDFIERGPV